MKKLLLLFTLLLLVGCNFHPKPIENYNGYVITNMIHYNDVNSQITLKSKDTIFDVNVLTFDILNKSIGDTIKSVKQPKVDLPEEYELITSNDTLKGYFDEQQVLHIEFNNKRK